jgi:hypothetical protein
VSDSRGNSWSNSQQATFTGGGQIGANYQFAGWAVVGVEADFDWLANNKNSSNAIDTNIGAIQFSANNRWMTTLAARFGVAADNWLFYRRPCLYLPRGCRLFACSLAGHGMFINVNGNSPIPGPDQLDLGTAYKSHLGQ